MKNNFDLRVVIGLFFGVVGIILFVASFLESTSGDRSELTNFWAGVVYIIFSAMMLIFWKLNRKHNKEAAEN